MLDIIISEFNINSPDITVYNKKVSYYLYVTSLNKTFFLIKVQISFLANLVFTIKESVLTIESIIHMFYTCITHKKMYYVPVINIENPDNLIFNLYYIYIVKMFSVKKWKSYHSYKYMWCFKKHYYKKFNTMKQYKCIMFI